MSQITIFRIVLFKILVDSSGRKNIYDSEESVTLRFIYHLSTAFLELHVIIHPFEQCVN